MSNYIEVLDETDPGSILDGDTLIHTDMTFFTFYGFPNRIDNQRSLLG